MKRYCLGNRKFNLVSHKKSTGVIKSKHVGYTPRERMWNCIWDFILGDEDDHPSVPHAHAREGGYRLDAWNGLIYPAGNERKRTIGKLKRKELDKLHNDSRFRDFAADHIQWYKSAHPQYKGEDIPLWMKDYIAQQTSTHKISLMKNQRTQFSFECEAYMFPQTGQYRTQFGKTVFLQKKSYRSKRLPNKIALKPRKDK